MTAENEADARELVARLGADGTDARLIGAGVHWHVDLGPVGARAMRVHCFWYERAATALLLGMNPANARSRLHGARAPYEGPEYAVILHDGLVRIADGRTRDAMDVVACARAWLAGVALDQLVRETPFVDQRAGAMRALAAQLTHPLRWDIGEEPAYELWIYGDGRSCKVVAGDDALACSFLLGQAQVAHAADARDVPAATEAWLVARVRAAELAARVPGVVLEAHADMLETDPAQWHWFHVRDRIDDPTDVLASMRDLLVALAASPAATRFYSYSSLNRLCFSASSHYPWVDAGLPMVAPAGDGLVFVGDARCDVGEAVQRIEAALAASPIRPIFGSAPHHELPRLAESLARLGCVVRPQLVQRGAWYRLEVADAAGARRCTVDGRRVTFIDATGRLDASWPTLDDAARAIRGYCEGGATFDEIAADPRAQHVSHRRPG